MAFGTLGSTLNDELNRLANGGTYRDKSAMVDEALAAKQWANRENIIPYSTDTVGILNEIAALGPNRQNWYDFNGVCNYLAGTTGLPAAAALRQITTTGDILTSLASYYVDAATPRYNYPGYIYLPGIATQYLLTPDATALDITGDIDIRMQIALDDWTPVGDTERLLTKRNTNFAYGLKITTTGAIQLNWSADGTTQIAAVSTVSPTVADGAALWIRATLDVDNGATGNTTTFYTSTDGTTWTQLGATVVKAGTTSIYSSSDSLYIGTDINSGYAITGKLYNAQIFAGLTGTDKRLDVDLTTNVTSATYNQFTATTGQLVTINGQDTLTNGGTAGSLLPTTVGSSLAADSNDPKFLDHTGTNYVYLPGIANNWISVPNSTALQITGDIDLRFQLALDDWTPATAARVLSKFSAGQAAYLFEITTAGQIIFAWYPDIAGSPATVTSTASISAADGATLWIRATLDVDNGAGGNDVKFFTSINGTTWTQLGTTVTNVGTTSIGAGNSVIGIGATSSGAALPVAGKLFRAQILNGIDGTTVLDVDTSVITSGADTYVVPTTYTGQAGAYFTGTGLSLNGVAGNYVSTPDATQLDITGDLDLRCKVALTDWTPSAVNYLIGKYNSSNISYSLRVDAAGTLALVYSTNGTATTVRTSTVATGITDGATKWVRATLDVDNGASGNDVAFYLSDDGVTWTQLGATVTNAGTTSIFSGTAILEIGSIFAGTTGPAAGTFYEAIVKSGIDGFTVFDADFTQVPANALRMTESSSYKAVVTLNTTRYATINRSTSGRKTVAVTQPTWLFGTDDYMEVNNRYMAHSTAAENYVYLSGASGNYMSVADNPPLDITGDIDIQVRVALDDWTPGAYQAFVSKFAQTGDKSFVFQISNTNVLNLTWSANNTTLLSANSTVAPTITDGATLWIRATLDVDNGASGNTVTFFTSTDGITWTQLGSPVVTAGVTSIYSGNTSVQIGTHSSTSSIAKGKFFRTIIKNGIDGTVVLDADASVITLPSQTTFVDRSSNAYTVTINKSGVGTFVSTGNYMYLPGIASNYAQAPDSAALDITGDIDLRVKVAMDDWTPSASSILMEKAGSSSDLSYSFRLNTDGTLLALIGSSGTAWAVNVSSSIATGVTDGATKWVRLTCDLDNGASGSDTKFWTSDDGITWTQLGTTRVGSVVTAIYVSGAQLGVGARGTDGGVPSRGKFFRAQVLNGIGGTVAFDANFESSITSLNQASFTESSTNGATVTINRSGSTFRSAGVIDAGYLYPGATNTFANSTTDFLNFGATDSATLLVFTRQWNTPANFGRTISKESTVNTASGYLIQNFGTGLSYTATINSVTSTSAGAGTPTYTAGSATLVAFVLDRGAQTLVRYMNTTGTSVSAAGVGSLSSISPLDIGRNAQSGGGLIDMEFVGAAIFRTALTATQIRQITNYFANREAYL